VAAQSRAGGDLIAFHRTRAASAASLTGLAVAWGGTALLVSPAARLLGPSDRLSTQILGQLAFWAVFAIVIAIVLYWEKQPLASLGLRPVRWSSIGWGLLLAAVLMYVAYPIQVRALRALGLAGFEPGIARVVALPLGFRVFAVLTAGIVEDTLFLGFALQRLRRLIGRDWIAAAISITVTAFLHWPNWGAGPVLAFVFSAAIGTAFFLWRQDLLANIVAHTITDGMAFLIPNP
jgi:uncharacterized protein